MSRVRADQYTNSAGTGSPLFPNGVRVTGVATATTFNGNISGTTGSFTGNVSVGGTLTYEDVTNVDSVGIITAQTGIKVLSGGINAVGVVTATSFSGDGSNLSNIQAGVANFVASGAIPIGSPVVVNTDGTVGVPTATGASTDSVGSAVVFESASTGNVRCAFDSTNGKVVFAYEDAGNSNYGTAIVGTVSGSSISFGTPVVFESAAAYPNSVAFDSTNGKVVIVYRDTGNSSAGTAVVGTVSGNSISFGTPVVFNAGYTNDMSIAFDSGNGKMVIAYRDQGGNSSYGTAIVGTVSGDSISFGSEVVFESAATSQCAAVYDAANGKVVIGFRDDGNSYYGTAVVGTVSGTSISFGSAVVFEEGNVNPLSGVYDSANGKVVFAYQDGGNSSYGTAIVGTVNGTGITFGSAVVFEPGSTNHITATFDTTPGVNKVVIAYRDGDNSNYGTAIVGTVSGTSISFGNALVYSTSNTMDQGITYDSTNDKVVIGYRDYGNSSYGKAVVFTTNGQVTNLTSENYIGIAEEAISDGATGKINIVSGINTSQTGLTTGRTFYVQNSGGISTSASNPSVVAGTAISDTSIIVKG